MMDSAKMMKSTKTMILMTLLATVMVVSLAAPAMAEQKQHGNGSSGTAPLKDQGITSCDLSPSGCKSTSESAVDSSANNAPKDQGKKNCDFSFARCESSIQSATDPEHNPDKDSAANTSSSDKDKPLKDQGISSCDLTPSGCPSSVADPKTGIIPTIPNDKEKDPAQGKNSTPQTATTASDVHGCPYDDYNYDSDLNVCLPTLDIVDTLGGDKPWPKSVGGYVGLAGHLPGDILEGTVVLPQIGLHYIGDGLVDFGEGGGPIGWGMQGVGYTLGFAGDAAGTIVGGAGEIVSAVADEVGDAIDTFGDAIGSLL